MGHGVARHQAVGADAVSSTIFRTSKILFRAINRPGGVHCLVVRMNTKLFESSFAVSNVTVCPEAVARLKTSDRKRELGARIPVRPKPRNAGQDKSYT